MKRHDEDRWIELAFEELSEADAAELKRLAEDDPQASKTLESYAVMREGLAGLRDVPEMQMSCDRLRDAILAGGLKEPRGSWWAWLAVPTAVAASAFVLTLVVRKPSAPPVVAATQPVESQPYDIELKRSDRPVFENLAQKTVGSPLAEVKFRIEGDAEVKNPVTPRKSSTPYKRVAVAPTSERVAKKEVEAAPRPSLDATTMGLTAEGAGADPSANTIIFISPDQNEQTGAQRATEVESVSNVLIGG